MIKQLYTIDNLDCANCAEKIRVAISKMPEVDSCDLSFASGRIAVYLNKPCDDDFLQRMLDIATSIEDGVKIYPIDSKAKPTHESNHCCDCCHEHECHEHNDGCSCCHSDEHGDHAKAFSKRDIIELSISAVFLILAFVARFCSMHEIIVAILFALSTIIAGYGVFFSSIKSLIKLQIGENLLMSIAVIAAFILGEYPESAMVAILFRLGELFENAAIGKSRRSIKALSEIRPDIANLRAANGKIETVDARTVKVGDIIEINPFERIPLDGIVIEGQSNIDCSAITGESVPVFVSQGDEVQSGSMNGEKLIAIKVTGEFENSTASRILEMVEEASLRKGRTEQLMTRFAKIYTPVVIILACIIAFLPPILGFGQLSDWIMRALSLLVASCPCAVVISVPLCYYAGIGKASGLGLLVKGSKFVESGAKTKAVLFDKTGTLTKGSLEVKDIVTLGNYDIDKLIAFAASVEAHSSHPAALAIVEHYYNKYNKPILSGEGFTEIPAIGVSASIDGYDIKCGSKRILDDSQSINSLPKDVSIYIMVNGKLEGGIVVGDQIRDEAKQAINNLRSIGIERIAILSGDNENSVKNIAAQCGIDEIYAGLLPQDKLTTLEKIQKEVGNVMFVGDGINDSPVLSAADTGAAMGFGTQSAIESADLVIAGDNLTSLAKAIKLFRHITFKAKTNIIMSLLFKAAVIILAMLGYAPMWLAVFADVGVSLLAVLNACTINKVKI